MYKEIIFATQDGSGTEARRVDLSKLGYEAMSMADKISSTDNKNADSHVLLCCKYINAELYRRIVDDKEGVYSEDRKRNARFNLNCIDGGSFDCEMPFGEMVRTAFHMWDTIKADESPEEYFERQVLEFKKNDRDMVLAEPMVPVRYYRIKNDMTVSELAGKSGFDEEVIERIEGGKAKASDLDPAQRGAIAGALGVDAGELEIPYENTEYLIRTRAF